MKRGDYTIFWCPTGHTILAARTLVRKRVHRVGQDGFFGCPGENEGSTPTTEVPNGTVVPGGASLEFCLGQLYSEIE